MKTKILVVLAVALMAGPMTANAGFVYTFADAETNPTFSLSFTVDDFVTTGGPLSVTPFSASEFTFTQAQADMFATGILLRICYGGRRFGNPARRLCTGQHH